MYRIYIINGFEYSREYFLNNGRFTKSEIEKLLNGDIVEKDGERYKIENLNGI